jgi:hypothetical protein
VNTLLAGWNLISVPRQPSSLSPEALFPGQDAPVSGFSVVTQQYYYPPLLEPGKGYWVLYSATTVNAIGGTPLDSVVIAVDRPTWVLVGSLTATVPVAHLTTSPSEALSQGTIFRYNTASQSYEAVQGITPGEGHWMYVTQACTITIRR